jgi:hypothetical protein
MEVDMRMTTNNERQDSLRNFTCWKFEPSGDAAADCATGRRLAREYLDWRHAPEFPILLGYISASIAKLDRPHSGIESGFFAALSEVLSTADIFRPGPRLRVIDGGRG